jgi:tryptophanyl-tRNA synthetase
VCPLHQVHKLVGDGTDIAEWDRCCRVAGCGCVAHKRAFAEDLNAYLRAFRTKRAEFAAKPGFAWDVLADGAARVRPAIDELMGTVRRAMHVDAES